LGAVPAIGLMSGTSLDGVDVALIETDGERIAQFGPTGYRPYSDHEQALLRQALQEGAALPDRFARRVVMAQADTAARRSRPPLETADAVGWSSQSIEAPAFAYLAVRTVNGLPITFPATTGVKQPLRGGIVSRPRS
jgi:1,6-anhydro-N-acetylmuramate kinase